jgi:hypothetical protein
MSVISRTTPTIPLMVGRRRRRAPVAGREEERHTARRQQVGHRVDPPTRDIDVEDGDVDGERRRFGQCLLTLTALATTWHPRSSSMSRRVYRIRASSYLHQAAGAG